MAEDSEYALEVLREGPEFTLYRGKELGNQTPILAVSVAAEQPSLQSIRRLEHEYALASGLDAAWAARPLAMARHRGRMLLILEDSGGEPLDQAIEQHKELPIDLSRFLRIAIGLAVALGQVHKQGLIHKDIKPANALVDERGRVWLTGFGVASRLPRERQQLEAPQFIAGSLPYMAPEQTGRMNRSIDSRSDLYSLGVTLYEILTSRLPFTASDPMEWVHCHIARRAVSPTERISEIPQVLSSIVMKLLLKTAEERYQTAGGVEVDLRRCLVEWQLHGRIEPFPLAIHDTSGQLMIPEQLYGRETEIDSLLASFDRVVVEGTSELVLISGYSGVGKSSVVNELHKVLVPSRGLFAAGKFDQYKRDSPYSTLAQAFQTLVRQILVKSEGEVDRWRRILSDAVGVHGQLIVNLVPELEFIIGKQPPVSDLPSQEAQNRFKAVFRRFLGAFATPEHPLVLFLDDLQWLDAATLDLIGHLITHSEVRHLLLVGAYRDDEVGPAHLLLHTLDTIKKTDARIGEIKLGPLRSNEIGQLTASAIRCDIQRARPLSQLVQEKTGGNPFFAIQFLTELADEALLTFDPVAQAWHWEIDRIHAKGYTDNVVDLMVEKLKRLSPPTQDVLKQLACLGHATDVAILTLVQKETEEAMHETLREAVYAGLIDQQDGAYRFLHDRIQQAVYSLIPDEHRVDAHLLVGRTLLANMTDDQLVEHLFDVAGQLNRGAGQLIEPREKFQLATLNLRAGRKAKASAAYVSASVYLAAGMAMLDKTSWNNQYELTFGLWLERAECEFLSGNFEEAEQLIIDLLQRAASKVDLATTYRLKVLLHTLKSENAQAVDSALSCLRLFGIDISAHPTEAQVQAEYETVWQTLGGQPIENLIDLPMMTDPEMLAAMDVLSVLLSPANHTDFHLWSLLACRIAKMTMQHGTCGASAHGYADLGQILGPVFRRYRDGYRFAELACDVVDKQGFVAYRGKAYHAKGVVAVWTQPIATSIDFLQTAFRIATETGDLTVACYCMDKSITNFLARNDPLEAVWRESERGLDLVRKARFHDVATVIEAQQRFVATMQGRTLTFSTFSDAQFDEVDFEAQITADGTATAACLYWILKLQARFLSGDYVEALASAETAKELLWAAPVHFQRLDYIYYTALTLTTLYENASVGEKGAWNDLLALHLEQLREWAENYPPTFGDKHALVAAEIARIEGRDADAMRLYEEAISSAHDQGFVQTEGLAYELAARFYNARGSQISAIAHLRHARRCYLRWGAEGKARQLDRLYPHLAPSEAQGRDVATGSRVQHLDAESVIIASQALSGEIELPKLIKRLMRTLIENAGADRGLLILPSGGEYLIHAEARAAGNQIEVALHQEPITPITCPESLVRYVIRTQESVILDDASKPNLFSVDDYLSHRQSKSILCVPLIKQGELTGILLLENALTSHAFTPARIAVLELLAAQAAISLENTRLYSDLQEREAKVRRLVDSNIIGICIFDLDGRITEANEAFLQIVGYGRDDVTSGSLRWNSLTPSEWSGADERAFADMASSGTCRPYEKDLLRKNNDLVPVLVGGATFDELRHQGVAFVVDLTERKRAEAELAHANRVATMGQLAASIVHEVNQPIAATLTNAGTAMRFLARQPPDLEGAKHAIDRIIRDGKRTADIVSRIRDFSKNAPARKENLEINETILEISALARLPMSERAVVAKMQLAEGLPRILGDRVQLQQVILNLIMNAIEAMSEGGQPLRELSISTSKADSDAVLVAVSDTGPGLSQSNPDSIFEAFYTTKSSGLGMGLPICRSIVEAHGGRIWATPNKPHGAVFSVLLPIGEKSLENPPDSG
ncbi:ATP-binding sensor histidine kinase [Mesorhizobium sp. LNHC221B00]|uniref:ATP-binding sensor histidine kinase n=1 Tax=Mesorhizobium sp. LNHC221B00 TaxID=1287233 RepID=UPI001FD9B346|nr:ATP-binding sensor histidine kinase [Mesorhizobium sp. LNHC221B00]